MSIYTHIPFITSDNKELETSNNLQFNVREYASNTFNINLYQSSAEEIRVDKTDYLTLISTINGVLRDTTSITTLSLEIYYEGFPNFNYVYIEAFNRYYYVTDITSIRNNLWEISLSIDVLMSYKDGLLQLKGFIERNETVVDNYIADKKRVIQEGYTYSVLTVDNDLFDTNVGSYIITGILLSQNNPEYYYILGGTKFSFDNGETWQQYIDGASGSRFVVLPNNTITVAVSGFDKILTLNGTAVLSTDTIQNQATYTWEVAQ